MCFLLQGMKCSEVSEHEQVCWCAACMSNYYVNNTRLSQSSARIGTRKDTMQPNDSSEFRWVTAALKS